ncbi:hypothetical protein [Duganella callida]|uniref:DUF1640 domain-containing protein n=1 Tax=Duganella callida TaxID=2561932 RepID=A0A4Y9SH95_9BURK|nr:hypothetical protein [Duganella callida]TFW20896.1 hypothetical protein E4L98_14000 [Duganella callida]
MDADVAERCKQLSEEMHNTFATKVELMAFREAVAVQFGDVRVQIARLEATLIKWFVATAVTLTGLTASLAFALGRYLH